MGVKRTKKVITVFLLSILISGYSLAGQITSVANQPAQDKNLALEYAKKLGFGKNQILNVEIVDNDILKVYIDECSFCGMFRNVKVRNDIAHKTLGWFLNKNGHKKGTVEWYNRSKLKIMSVSGSLSDAEIKSGLPCALK